MGTLTTGNVIVRNIHTKDVGILLHSWDISDPEKGDITDCYVAFFGRSIPDINKPPSMIPYISRYFSTALEVKIDDKWVPMPT